MFGREIELQKLESLYNSKKFEFLIIYGRRRIGKTTILQAFAKRHRCIFFSAQEKNDALNLHDFSKVIQEFFSGEYISDFSDWESAFSFLTNKLNDKEKLILMIDEFPFIASTNPAIKSILQHYIDHDWKNKNIMLILCGSSVSFMLNDVMGYKSPLFGRITSSFEVEAFDYLDSARFFDGYSSMDKMICYGILGGVPRYLESFDNQLSLHENIKMKILDSAAYLNDEPQTLLRMELREPSIYNSILEAVSKGKNKILEIADYMHEDKTKCSKYMLTLQTLRLVERVVPCGENENSRKAIYEMADNYYKFWYRFVFSNRDYFELLGIDQACDEIMVEMNDYMGVIFEKACREYIVRLAKKGKLPFVPFTLGKWWGNNPVIRAQDDVDILGLNKDGTKGLFGECKFRNKPMTMDEYDDLVLATHAFPNLKERYLMFISKSGYVDSVKRRADEEGAVLLTIDNMYEI